MSDDFDFGGVDLSSQGDFYGGNADQKQLQAKHFDHTYSVITASAMDKIEEGNILLKTAKQAVLKQDIITSVDENDENGAATMKPPLSLHDIKANAVNGVTNALAAKLLAVKEKGEAVKEKGEAVKEKGEAVKEKGEAVKEKGEAVKEKGEAVKEKGEAVKEKGEAVKEKGEAVKEKGEAVKEKGEATGDESVAMQDKSVSQAEKIELGDKFEQVAKQLLIAEKKKSGGHCLVPFDHKNKNHQKAFDEGKIIQVFSNGRIATEKRLGEELRKGPLLRKNPDGTETEIDKSLLREFTSEERDNLHKVFTQYRKENTAQTQSKQKDMSLPSAQQPPPIPVRKEPSANRLDGQESSIDETAAATTIENIHNQKLETERKEKKKEDDRLSAEHAQGKKKSRQKTAAHDRLESIEINKKAISKEIKMADLAELQIRQEADIIAQRSTSTPKQFSNATNDINNLVLHEKKLNENEMIEIVKMLLENINAFEGQKYGVIVVKVAQTLLERATNGDQPYKNELALIEKWAHVISFLGLQ